MAKPPTIEVSERELEKVFQALEIWGKIRDRRISTEPITHRSVPSWRFPGGTSEIVRHRNIHGLHVATTHRITTQDGATPHWDAKDLRLGDVVIWAV
jgi:hypothetical protein